MKSNFQWFVVSSSRIRCLWGIVVVRFLNVFHLLFPVLSHYVTTCSFWLRFNCSIRFSCRLDSICYVWWKEKKNRFFDQTVELNLFMPCITILAPPDKSSSPIPPFWQTQNFWWRWNTLWILIMKFCVSTLIIYGDVAIDISARENLCV